MTPPNSRESSHCDRRDFLRHTAGAAVAAGAAGPLLSEATATAGVGSTAPHVIRFEGPDSLFHGAGWETLNPGYWKLENGALRRRLTNMGDRARSTGFPFHSATHGGQFKTDYDPSLPVGLIYRRDWYLTGAYEITARFTYRNPRPAVADGDNAEWKMYQAGDGFMGVAVGARSLFESYNRIRHAIRVGWCDDGTLRLIGPRAGRGNNAKRFDKRVPAPNLQPGETVILRVKVAPADGGTKISAELVAGDKSASLTQTIGRAVGRGYAGLAGQGLMDFECNEFTVSPGNNTRNEPAEVECFSCYPLGDTLHQVDGEWRVRFVSIFASDGERVELRIADTPQPNRGWNNVPVAGSGRIVNHEWRRHTAVIEARLPASPAAKTLYYTVWKDGVDVTADTRVGTAATGPGTGLVGDVPASGEYVGRLPRLSAPYRLCGLSCHAITSGLQQRTDAGLKILGGGDDWQFRDQPTVEAYKHIDDYDFQIMVWEDDVWYMELVLYPPSTDDAWKIVTQSICGPTSRWQMMRHWNVINPGDHDYGMDDVKGPEQIALRRVDGLGQDPDYMRRNFRIVHHLITGAETVDPLENPKKWRAWKMPDRDFTFVILDSRLWRSSQDVDIWDDAGWGAFKSLYDRTDPTRSLLGEEQFAWLAELLATDSSRLICLTGINGMHTVWGPTDQRNRVAADYAGWVKAGADRVLELLGARDGVVTVYGDVHNGCIMRNREHGVIECSFGPIGRSGGRAVIPDFGPRMKDFDGRPLEIHALYHKTWSGPELTKHDASDPFYWNFLEMEFDPRAADPTIGLRVRNMIDPPTEKPRGGGSLETTAAATGRPPASRMPETSTLANADVRIVLTDGRPLRGTRSSPDGQVPATGLIDVPPHTRVIVTAFDGTRTESRLVVTEPA